MSKLALTREKPVDSPQNVLEREIKTYEAHKQDLLRDSEGQYVLIKGTEIIGIFPTRNAALSKGYSQFPKAAFLMRQIKPYEELISVPSILAVFDN